LEDLVLAYMSQSRDNQAVGRSTLGLVP
jgi:hypothetical protein